MSTITKEQAKDLRNAFECWQQDYDPVEDKEQYDMFGLGIVAMDSLLASLEAEPVAYSLIFRNMDGVLNDYVNANTTFSTIEKAQAYGRGGNYVEQNDGSLQWVSDPSLDPVVVPLYTAPPAPVSDSLLSELLGIAKRAADEADECAHSEFSDDSLEHSAAIADCERRAAMLQGAEPVTTDYKLPDDFDFDRFNDVVWLETVASNPHMHSPTTSTIAMVALELNRKLAAGNSPVIPDEKGSSLQLRNLIRQRHAEWSQATFGDVGPVGPLKHLSKEALEAAAEPEDLSEWADMQFLLWDAQRRAGISDVEITAAMEEKLKVNMARQWPEPKDGEPRFHIKKAPQQEA